MQKGEEKREGQRLKKKMVERSEKRINKKKNIPRKMTVVFSNTRGREIFE